MLCEVLRPIPGPNGLISPGEIVDVSEWRNADRLIGMRYLRRKTNKVKTEDPKASASREAKKGLTGAGVKRKLV